MRLKPIKNWRWMGCTALLLLALMSAPQVWAQAQAQAQAQAPAQTQGDEDAAAQLIQACWQGNDHPRMSACMMRTAAQARAELQRAEADLRQRMQGASARSSAQRQRLLRGLNASTRAHAAYRQAMCEQRRALASLGNGEVDNGLACEIVLDRQRTQVLRADTGWL